MLLLPVVNYLAYDWAIKPGYFRSFALKNILGRLFAAWAAICFVTTMIPVVIIMWIIGIIREPRRTKVFRRISKVWMNTFFVMIGCRLKIKGIDNFEAGKNYIVICNHNSFMDVPITTPEIPGPNKTIAKSEMSKIPLFGLIYKRGSILVDRKNKNSRRESFNKMKEVLGLGMHMCIYPEGTRNKTQEPLKEFHDGAFKLAIDTGKPLMPAIIFNTRNVLPPGKPFYIWPSKMELHFLECREIKPTDNIEDLKNEMFLLMGDYFREHSKA